MYVLEYGDVLWSDKGSLNSWSTADECTCIHQRVEMCLFGPGLLKWSENSGESHRYVPESADMSWSYQEDAGGQKTVEEHICIY